MSASGGGDRGARPRIVGLQRPPWGDVVLAAVVCALDVVAFSELVAGGGTAAVIAYAVLGYAALAWRRVAPVPVFFVLWFHNLLAVPLIGTYRPTLGLLVALYTVSAMTTRRISVSALVAAVVSTTITSVTDELETTPDESPAAIIVVTILLYTMLNVGAWALGQWAQTSRGRLERERTRRADAITAERSRIARDLHDIVSHSVSVMVLQAAGARRVLASDPDRADQALQDIESVGKESMGELRRLLGVLRDGALATGDGGDEREPGQGLADLESLAGTARLTGLSVSLAREGQPGRLDPSVDLSAYRIVQEALTNAAKHAGPGTHVTVRQVWTSTLLLVEVVDDGAGGRAGPGLSTGHGLLGLQERARAVGGQLTAAPEPGGGFRVSATLPVAAASPVSGAEPPTVRHPRG